MEERVEQHALVVVALMTLAAIWVAASGTPAVVDMNVAPLSLPDRVGDYAGVDMLFCQNEQCLRSFPVTALPDRRKCPVCGSELASMALAEKTRLPADTGVLHKQYVQPGRPTLSVSIVISGKEQRSIHRPQQCLPAQGFVLQGSRSLSVPIQGRAPLVVRLLDTQRTVRTFAGREQHQFDTYAYWFAGATRETQSIYRLLLWMSADRIFRNTTQRWAYVAISTSRQEGSDAHLITLRDFIAEIYPLLRTGASMPLWQTRRPRTS